METNIKHSTNFFRKVAAPTGQNNFKKIKSFSVEIFFKSVVYIDIDEKHHIYSSYVIFWPEWVNLRKYINILSMESMQIETEEAKNVLI